jgi:hypothetical protein
MDDDSKDALEAVAKGATSALLDRVGKAFSWPLRAVRRALRRRIPLLEAATKIYEAGRSAKSIYAMGAERMPNKPSPTATLKWIACFAAGKVTIWGRRLPSTVHEPIDRMQAMYGTYSENLAEFHVRGDPATVFTDLQVSRPELRKVIALFREGVDLSKEKPKAESEMNSDLRTEVMKFVADLREWLMDRQTRYADRIERQNSAVFQSTDKTQMQRIFDEFVQDDVASATAMNDEYDAKFKGRAIVFRDELLTRVKHPEAQSRFHRMYERPMTAAGMLTVADDLERLARQLH